MSLPVPTTQDLADGIIGQLETSLAQTLPIFPKAFIRVLAKVFAAVVVILYRYAGFIFLQLFVAYATMEEVTINGKRVRPLVEWGRLFGVGDPYGATASVLNITVTVTNQTGTLAARSLLLRAETGVVYETVTAVALNAATVPVLIRAVSDQDGNGGLGAIGNLVAGDKVSFANPLANVARDAVVASVSTSGADAETVDAYRARVYKRVQRRPQGGAYADYYEWAIGVAGIVAVYPYAGDPGELDVYVEATPASSGSADGIPTGPQLAAVKSAISLDVSGRATQRPVNAAVNVKPITRTQIDLIVYGLQADDIASAKTAINSGVDEWLRSREPFIEGLSTLPRDDRITVAAIGGIVDGIVSAIGGSITSVALSIGSIPETAYTLGAGEKAKLSATPLYL